MLMNIGPCNVVSKLKGFCQISTAAESVSFSSCDKDTAAAQEFGYSKFAKIRCSTAAQKPSYGGCNRGERQEEDRG
jgi:hypothetical protein